MFFGKLALAYAFVCFDLEAETSHLVPVTEGHCDIVLLYLRTGLSSGQVFCSQFLRCCHLSPPAVCSDCLIFHNLITMLIMLSEN
jgi:hypothetical protein